MNEKKGLGPLAWVGIGCGILLIAGVVVGTIGLWVGARAVKGVVESVAENPVKAVAETAIRVNPELEHISTDDEAGEITFRNKSTGEEMTLDFESIAEGRFSLTTEEGEFTMEASGSDEGASLTFKGPEGEATFGASVDLDDLPEWVPLYPRASQEQGGFSSTTPEGVAGVFTLQTADSPETVREYFSQRLEEQGYEISTHTMSQGGEKASALVAQDAAQERHINLTVSSEGSRTTVVVQYNGPRQ